MTKAFPIVLLIAAACAASEHPLGPQTYAIDRVAEAASMSSPVRLVALEILERLSEARKSIHAGVGTDGV
jgi:hypothetical protein